MGESRRCVAIEDYEARHQVMNRVRPLLDVSIADRRNIAITASVGGAKICTMHDVVPPTHQLGHRWEVILDGGLWNRNPVEDSNDFIRVPEGNPVEVSPYRIRDQRVNRAAPIRC